MNRLSGIIAVTALMLPHAALAQELVSDLQIDKSVADDTVQVGETIEFTLTIFNGGPDAATGIIIQDPLPSDLAYVTASHPDNFILNGDTLAWNFPTLEVNSSLTVTFEAAVNGPIGGGTVINSATVSSDVFDADGSNNAAEVSVAVSSSNGGGWTDPSVMVRVDDYCIDKYEASLDTIPSTTKVVAISVPDVLPAVNISQIEAKQACLEAGKRLCTDSEWLRACQSPAGFVYPYGNTLQPGVCADSGTISNTGAHPGCITEEGAVDMVGNINEWTFDPLGTARGGFFGDIAINGPGCLYSTVAFNTLHKDERIGFRCCADDCVASREVDIDIKPGSDPNCFNSNGHGVIPVAILGKLDFDVSQIDTASLYFGGLEVRVRGNKGPLCSMEDMDDDGITDLVCHFEDDATSWSTGESVAELEGLLIDGTKITGSGSICIVP